MKKAVPKSFWDILREIPVLESFFNKVAGLQDCCNTYLLHTLLRFYFFR